METVELVSYLTVYPDGVPVLAVGKESQKSVNGKGYKELKHKRKPKKAKNKVKGKPDQTGNSNGNGGGNGKGLSDESCQDEETSGKGNCKGKNRVT